MAAVETIVRAVAAAYDAYQAAEAAAEALSKHLASSDQAELKARLAELRARNDAVRERRQAQLAEAARR